MTQEEKQLLLEDLCARLPYKPRVRYYYRSMGSKAINGYSDEGYLSYQNLEDFSIYPKYGLEKTSVCNILPFLRPMSSMTEEEAVQLSQYACIGEDLNGEFIDEVQRKDCAAYIDWLNAHHFDYRELIHMGLALEAPEDMYNTKTE